MNSHPLLNKPDSNHLLQLKSEFPKRCRVLSPSSRRLKEVVIVAGIYVFFLSFGLFQEKIFNQRDPATGQKFDSPCFVVLLISVGNVLLALAIYAWRKMTGRALYNNEIKPLIQDGTWRQIALCSLTSSLSMVCTNASLSHVSYPTQVLGKSAKLVPVILGSVIVYGQQFPWYDWAGVGLVTTGLIGFNWGGKNKPALDTANPLLGWLLLGLSLLGDALTGPRQDAIMRKRHLDSVQFMLIQNTFTALNSLVLTLLLEGSAPLKFVSSNIDLAPSFLGLTLAGGLGQTFIYAALISFGSLYLSLITTTRKFFTVFASVFYFSHQLSSLQWLSVAVIFFALGLQSAMKHLSKRKM